MSEQCPLLASDYEGVLVPTWDKGIPDQCKECYDLALINPNVYKIEIDHDLPADTLNIDVSETDTWHCSGVQVQQHLNERLGISEAGIDMYDDEKSYTLNRTTFIFKCLNSYTSD